MKKQGPVLATTTMDAGSDHALREAGARARSMNASLHVCHVLPELFGHRPLFPQLRELEREQREQIRQSVEMVIRDQLQRVLGEGYEAEIHLEAGSPHSEILRLAEELKPSLIVVGAASDRVSTVAERVVRHAPCAVLVAIHHSGKVVLAGTDFSDPARPAIDSAVEEAHRRRRPCFILHAIDFTKISTMAEMVAPAIAEQVLDTQRADAKRTLKEIGARLGESAQTVLKEGRASEAILKTADELDADLIVLGTHGRSGLRRLALGSVAEPVVRRSRRSVLVVRLNTKNRGSRRKVLVKAHSARARSRRLGAPTRGGAMEREVRWLRSCCGRTGSRTRRALVRLVPRARLLAPTGRDTPIWDDIGVASRSRRQESTDLYDLPEADSRRADLGGV
jgi:nucleotide-binding universal stress UspA family protein